MSFSAVGVVDDAFDARGGTSEAAFLYSVTLRASVGRCVSDDDPSRWWNPAAEMQAIDRTHRLGQFKPIYATRFIIEDTVEERIIKLQVSTG